MQELVKQTMKLLDKQCQQLGIPLFDKELVYSGKPESALLSKYKENGFVGASCEAGAILTLIKSCMLDGLSKYNYFNDRNDAVNRYLEAQLMILDDKKEELLDIISHIPESAIFNNYREIISSPFIKSTYPSLSAELGIAMFYAIGREKISEIATEITTEPYQYRSGWPDLTLVNENTIAFVEVKTTDNLHSSQLRTIPMLLKVLPDTVSVCRLKKLTASPPFFSSPNVH